MSATSKDLIIYGNGQLAELAWARITHSQSHSVVAFTVDQICIKNELFGGLPLIPFEQIQSYYSPVDHQILIAIGPKQANQLRARRFLSSKEQGYSLAQFISPQAMIAPGVEIGENCIIGEGVMIQPFVKIGNNVTIGSGCIISHHSVIHDHCYLAAGCKLAGGSILQKYVTLGMGAIIREGVCIEESALIGAGVVQTTTARRDGVYAAPEPIVLPLKSSQIN